MNQYLLSVYEVEGQVAGAPSSYAGRVKPSSGAVERKADVVLYSPKVLGEYVDRGLLRLGRGKVTILDPDTITAEAGD